MKNYCDNVSVLLTPKTLMAMIKKKWLKLPAQYCAVACERVKLLEIKLICIKPSQLCKYEDTS